MPLFLIERNFAEELEVTADGTAEIRRINDEIGVQWIFSFLSADKRKTYCLYEAPSPEAIRAAAARAGIPADVIVEVSELRPDMFGTPLVPSA
ncbi:nickel-binding protein [Elioraea rosea]|uniref:nickel-binding protein n=1 Tax=Elioraea rosea TaxID=2492390 RepID=UPI00118353C2|nr:nickel-binding protein [Elioraea rosea]